MSWREGGVGQHGQLQVSISGHLKMVPRWVWLLSLHGWRCLEAAELTSFLQFELRKNTFREAVRVQIQAEQRGSRGQTLPRSWAHVTRGRGPACPSEQAGSSLQKQADRVEMTKKSRERREEEEQQCHLSLGWCSTQEGGTGLWCVRGRALGRGWGSAASSVVQSAAAAAAG